MGMGVVPLPLHLPHPHVRHALVGYSQGSKCVSVLGEGQRGLIFHNTKRSCLLGSALLSSHPGGYPLFLSPSRDQQGPDCLLPSTSCFGKVRDDDRGPWHKGVCSHYSRGSRNAYSLDRTGVVGGASSAALQCCHRFTSGILGEKKN